MEFVFFAVFFIIFGSCGIIMPLFGITLAEGITAEVIVPMMIWLALTGVYFCILPHYAYFKKSTAIAITITAGTLYASALICGIVALVTLVPIFQQILSIATLANSVVTIKFLFDN